MIEKQIKDYLNANDIIVYMDDNVDINDVNYVTISKDNEFKVDGIWNATLTINVYSNSLYNTALLTENIVELLQSIGLESTNKISSCSINRYYENTDTIKKKYRYTIDADFYFIK